MRHFFITIVALLATAIGAHAQSPFYQACKAADNGSLQTVFIGKGLLQLVEQSSLTVNQMNFGRLVSKINCISIVTAEHAKEAKLLKKLFKEHFGSNKGFNLILEINQEGETTEIWEKKLDGGQSKFVLQVAEKGHEMTVIELTGTMTAQDIQLLMQNKKLEPISQTAIESEEPAPTETDYLTLI